jgi:hypothetical protein
MKVFANLDELKQYVGQEIGVSDWCKRPTAEARGLSGALQPKRGIAPFGHGPRGWLTKHPQDAQPHYY